MKKTIITLSLLAVSSLIASDDIRAEIAVTAGYNKFDSASKMDDASMFGIRATMYEDEVNKYGLQVGYEGATGIEYENSTVQTDVHRIFTHLVVDGEEEYNVIPYLFLGGGYEFLTDEIKGEPSQGFLDLGLGFKYFIDNNFKALIETRAIGKFDTRDLDFNVNVGIGYAFGGKQRTVFEPIIALGPQKDAKKIAPKTAINIVKAPMVQTTNHMDELTAMVNEIDTGVKTSSYPKASTVAPISSYDEIPMATTMPFNEVPTSGYKEVSISSGEYYVQMAALDSTSTQPVVNDLTGNGYSNTIVHTRGNTNLVLVGPYLTRADALTAKSALKSIRPDAFLYRMQ